MPCLRSTLQPAGMPCMDSDLQEALRSGRMVETLLNPLHPEDRLRFTLSRCICGLVHSRVADITRHLQTQHGPFYRAADEYALLLEEQQLDCVCNPRRHSQPRAHRCIAWRQLSMVEHIANPDHRFFYPSWTIEAESLVALAQVNPRLHAQAPQLIQQMADHMPALLLTQLNVCKGLGQHCALCNRSYQDVHALLQHMEQYHAAESRQCTALLKQLVIHFLAHVRSTSLPSTQRVAANVLYC